MGSCCSSRAPPVQQSTHAELQALQTKPPPELIMPLEVPQDKRDAQEQAKEEAREVLGKMIEELTTSTQELEVKEDAEQLGGVWTSGFTGQNTGCESNDKFILASYREVTTFGSLRTKRNFPSSSPTVYQQLYAVSYESLFYAKPGPKAQGPSASAPEILVHSETGFLFFAWDYTANSMSGGVSCMKGVVSERGINILAGGSVTIQNNGVNGSTLTISVKANNTHPYFGITQSAYLYATTRSTGWSWNATINLSGLDCLQPTISYTQVLNYQTQTGQQKTHTHKNAITKMSGVTDATQ